MKILISSAAVAVLCGCVAAPSRDNPSQFVLLTEGIVPTSRVQEFADCLLDGFDKAHFIVTNVNSRQQRRSASYRVETLSGSSVLVSADVFDDGRIQLWEAKWGVVANTRGERDAFSACRLKVSNTAEKRKPG